MKDMLCIRQSIRRFKSPFKPGIVFFSGFTARINELPPGESAAVLAFLYQHLEKPDFQMRFTWRKHSIAFWDNRCTQHLAIWDYYPNVRSGNRVQVEGDRPPVAA